MTDEKPVGRNAKGNRNSPRTRKITMRLPNGALNLRVAGVAGKRPRGFYVHADALEDAMGEAELNRPGILIVPVRLPPWNYFVAEAHEADSVREFIRGRYMGEKAHKLPKGHLCAFTRAGLDRKHRQYVMSRLPKAFPDSEWEYKAGSMPDEMNAEVNVVLETADVLMCIDLMALFLGLPKPDRKWLE